MKHLSIIILLLITMNFLCACAKSQSPELTARAPENFPGTEHTDALIYGGEGSWRAEVNSFKDILYINGATYQEVNAPQLNSMSLDDLLHFNTVIVPGGDAVVVTARLNPQTRNNLRIAVQEHGLDYLGFCAGAWLAASPDSKTEQGSPYGAGIISGLFLKPTVYSKQGLEFNIAAASFPDGSQRDLLWYGGPITPNINGGVIAKYPDGNPAISQIWSGRGLVIISGFHPTATKPILRALNIYDKSAIDPDLTWKILFGVIHKVALQSF